MVGPGLYCASYEARMGQPGGERLWAPQVQQLHRTEQCFTPNEKTQAAAAEAEGLPDRAGMGSWVFRRMSRGLACESFRDRTTVLSSSEPFCLVQCLKP